MPNYSVGCVHDAVAELDQLEKCQVFFAATYDRAAAQSFIETRPELPGRTAERHIPTVANAAKIRHAEPLFNCLVYNPTSLPFRPGITVRGANMLKFGADTERQ